MAIRKVCLTVQDMTWEKCVSRVEDTLKNMPGVVDVKARLVSRNSGEAEIRYDPAEVDLDDIKRAVPTASGGKHNFTVISIVEER